MLRVFAVDVAQRTQELGLRLALGVQVGDGATLLGVIFLLFSVAMGAAWIPAWRASRVDPMVALRID